MTARRKGHTWHSPDMSSTPNVLLLAADKPAEVRNLLQADPSRATFQDEHGYSLLHAAVSYNHLDLLRALVNDFHVDINLKDEDGETALFVAETMECARVLVEELHSDTTIRGDEGKTAGQKIAEDGGFPEVAVYLRIKELERIGLQTDGATNGGTDGGTDAGIVNAPPPLPGGLSVDIGSMLPEEAGDVVDPEFRRRIEELASREDYQSEDGQRQLRDLVAEAIRGDIGQGREVRRRMD